MATDLDMKEALVSMAAAIAFSTELLTGEERDFVLIVFDKDIGITPGRIGAVGSASKERTSDALQFALSRLEASDYINTGTTH